MTEKKKRTYSREFPRSWPRTTIAADWAPRGLKKAAQKKAKAQGISLRLKILRLLAEDTGWEESATSSSGADHAAGR